MHITRRWVVPLAWDSRREEIVDKPAQHDFLRALIIKWLLIIPLHFRKIDQAFLRIANSESLLFLREISMLGKRDPTSSNNVSLITIIIIIIIVVAVVAN